MILAVRDPGSFSILCSSRYPQQETVICQGCVCAERACVFTMLLMIGDDSVDRDVVQADTELGNAGQYKKGYL